MRFRALIGVFLALCLGLITACADETPEVLNRNELTYDEIVNTGLANKCPQITSFTRGSIPIDKNQSFQVRDLCLEPQQYFVKEEPANKRAEAEFIEGKVLTRETSTLEQIRGTITPDEDGSLTLTEKDGIDFQAITVLLPGGEEVPFLFTIKNLVAKSQPGLDAISSATDFSGEFKVPSYRGQVFLDPKGRSIASGYDSAVALPARADDETFTRANVKQYVSGKGKITMNITKVDAETGEIAGTFESEQPSATDLGAEEPKDVKVRGTFYGIIEPTV
ncbi:MAG: Photosystem II manganese-stabilizing polypeptide [Cyanobacteria bacterium J083]|nr:MAG: Photosystem II manganese-stabilizing polypeptide [Cyanobacteria bacterium J083]